MNSKLFQLAPYRETQLPELADFFEEVAAPGALSRFIRRFAGTRFQCPDHQMLGRLGNEVLASQSLERNPSIDNVLHIMGEYDLSYERICDIYRVTTGRHLPGPVVVDDSTPKLRLEAAIEAANKHHKVPREQVGLAYGLKDTAMDEFRVAMGFKKRPKKKRGKNQ